MSFFRAWVVGWLLVAGFAVQPLTAQDVTVGAPYNMIGDSFYEHYGIHWGFRGRGFFFDNGGGALPPQFGGFDPNADARFGFGGRNSFFNFTASQGNRRSIVSSTPLVTLPNGGFGAVGDTSIRPFVTEIVPVVGGQATSPVRERLDRLRAGETPTPVEAAKSGSSSGPPRDEGSASGGAAASDSTASRGDLSVAEIRQRQAEQDSAQRQEIDVLIEQARGSEERGKPGVARIYYQQAASRATGELQRSLRAKVQSLSIPAKAAPSR